MFCEQIKNSETDMYKLLVEHSPLGILLVDPAGDILSVNSRALEILGSPSEEETKKINMLTYPPLIHSSVSDIVKASLGGEKCVTGAIPYVTKWGKEIHVRFTAVPVFDENGVVCFCQLVMEDESKTEKISRELCTANKVFKTLIDNINYLIWMKDSDGRYIQVNKAYADFCGMPCYKLVGKDDVEVWGEEFARSFIEDDLRVLRTGDSICVEEVFDHPTLGRRYFRTTKTAAHDQDELPCGTVGVSIDITEQIERETIARSAIIELQDLLDSNTFIK